MDELTLHRYLDGRLDESQRATVEQALRADPAARRTLDALREEARLLGAALERQVEPSHRISDKVIAQLHLEERSRGAAVRTRRMFGYFWKGLATAAALVLCFYLVKPRDQAGSVSSGTDFAVTTNGDKRESKPGQRIYDKDLIETGKGQFIRYTLAGGAVIDVDEFSTLSMEKSGKVPILRLTRGRMGVTASDSGRGVQIELPQGVVTVQPASKADVWLPQPVSARWPALFFPADSIPQPAAADPNAAQSAVVTVFKGYAHVACDKGGSAIDAQQGTRAHVTKSEIQQRRVNLAGSRVLDLRGDDAIHGRNNLTPPEWTLLGLLEKPQFETLGRRWGLCDGTNARIAQALQQLDAALRIAAHTERAEKIAAAQKTFHEACETLPQNDERKVRARTLEGLAHFEEGMARVSSGNKKESDARDAFEAALGALPPPAEPAPIAADWQSAFSGGSLPALTTLAPDAQSALLTAFGRAAALYWHAVAPSNEVTLDVDRIAEEISARRVELKDSAEAFAKLHESLGRSAEAIAATFGEALCHEELSAYANSTEPGAPEVARRKAIDALLLILSRPLVNTDGAARHACEGLRQAALAQLVRLHARGAEAHKTLNAAHDFDVLYPLDGSSAAAKEIRGSLLKGLVEQKTAAFNDKRFENAVEACDALLIALDEADGHWMDAAQIEAGGGVRHIGVRLELLEALVGAKDWTRAAGEAHAIRNAVPAELQARFEALQTQINAKK